MNILQLLAKESYITYSKPLAKKVGVDESILFGELCSLYTFFDEEEFFCEQQRLLDDTCLTEYRLRNAMKTLQKEGLVKVTKKGLPAKNYYKLNEEKFAELLDFRLTSGCKFDTTGGSNFDSTGGSNFDTTIINKIDRNKIDNKIDNIISMYNQICVDLPGVLKITEARKKTVKSMLEKYTEEEIKTVFAKAESSDFLKGKNNSPGHSNFKADFDWLMTESRFIKVLEGRYDNTKQDPGESNPYIRYAKEHGIEL